MNAKWGYISKSGKLVIAPSFDSAAPFAERLAAVKTGGLWGYINKRQANCLIEPAVHRCADIFARTCSVKIGAVWTYVDKTGQIVIHTGYEEASSFPRDLPPVKMGGRWGYINSIGNIVINVQFWEAQPFEKDWPQSACTTSGAT